MMGMAFRQEHGKMKNKFVFGAAACFLLPVVLVYLYLFQPTVWAMLGDIFSPDKRCDAQVVINGRSHILPAYYKAGAAINRNGEVVPALLLCNIPLSSGIEHLKIFPDRIGVFQYPAKWFVVRKRYVLIREGALLMLDISDDMKGWGVNYRIREEEDSLIYEIPPSEHRDSVKITIPKAFVRLVPAYEDI